MQGQLIPIDENIFSMIFLHQIESHDIGNREIGIGGIAEYVSGHHPPGHFHGLAI